MKLFSSSDSTPNIFQIELPSETEQLRQAVRTFLGEAQAAGDYEPQCDAWLAGYSPEFSRKLGERGWLGLMWPKKYGGHERSALDRFVITEEWQKRLIKSTSLSLLPLMALPQAPV